LLFTVCRATILKESEWAGQSLVRYSFGLQIVILIFRDVSAIFVPKIF